MLLVAGVAAPVHRPAAAQAPAAPAQETPVAPRLEGFGTHEWPVTTRVPRARQFFNQGVKLLYGFNHPEALRSFREAARLDPTLAMAFWGQAMSVGPNPNAPLSADTARQAYDAIQAGTRAAAGASARERAIIEALARRFAAEGVGDRPALDRAYAAAMERVSTPPRTCRTA